MTQAEWELEGELLMRILESRGFALSLAFRIGHWWADRPWRNHDR